MAAGALMVIDVETLIERDSVEEGLEVGQGVDRHAHLADLALAKRMVGVEADLRGKVERDAQSGRALREQIAVALVGFLGGGIAGIFPHGPEPTAIHGRMGAAGEGELAGKPQLRFIARHDLVVGKVEPIDRRGRTPS